MAARRGDCSVGGAAAARRGDGGAARGRRGEGGKGSAAAARRGEGGADSARGRRRGGCSAMSFTQASTDPVGNASAPATPATWWLNHGTSAPHLRTLAIRILGLTCSSLTCERNWSVFDQIHTKRRSKLLHDRMRDLVFIKFNSRLKNKKQNKKRDPIEREVADVVLEDADNEQETEFSEEKEEKADPCYNISRFAICLLWFRRWHGTRFCIFCRFRF